MRKHFEEMETVLALEAEVLRSGALEDLPKLALQKQKAMDKLLARGGKGLDMTPLHRLQSKAIDNARLLVAARKGIEGAISLAEKKSGAALGLTTYGANGRKSELRGREVKQDLST